MTALALAVLLLTGAAEKRSTVSGIVRIKAATAKDVAPVVVYITGFGEEPEKSTVYMTQRSKTFVPDLLAITANQAVEFSNDDPVWHNVFSISKARTFDLGMTKKPEVKTITFAKTGVIDIFCNIHPQMVGTILVLPNRAFAIADKDGRYRIGNVPEGDYKIFAWSRRSDVQSKAIHVGAAAVSVDWNINQDKVLEPHKDKFGRDYKPGKY
jgi:plastocyanin